MYKIWLLLFFSIIISESCAMDAPAPIASPDLKMRKLYAKDFKELGVEYADEIVCRVDPRRMLEPRRLSQDQGNGDRPFDASWWEAVDKKYHAKVHLKYISDRVGYGVFTDEIIEKDWVVGEYTGELIDFDMCNKLNMQEAAYLMELGMYYRSEDGDYLRNLFIDAKRMGNFTRFVNHSYIPNIREEVVFAKGLWHIVFVARRRILADKQLFINYGPKYWEARNIKPLNLNELPSWLQ